MNVKEDNSFIEGHKIVGIGSILGISALLATSIHSGILPNSFEHIKGLNLNDDDFLSTIDFDFSDSIDKLVLYYSSYIYVNYWNLFNCMYECDFFPEHNVSSMYDFLASQLSSQDIDIPELDFTDVYMHLSLIRSLGSHIEHIKIEHYENWRLEIQDLQSNLAIDIVTLMANSKTDGTISLIEPFKN